MAGGHPFTTPGSTMDFGAFSIISLIYIVIGIRIVAQLIQNWRAVWDHNFTQFDRQIVDQAAFFVLIPISVILHEFGHAVAVWSFGGKVVGYGFYGFAGYVAYNPYGLSDVQQTIISAAGSIVNLLLCLLAIGVVLLKKPPMRAAFNELLIQFTVISGLNAFIVYPVLDMLSGLNGDWRQMYDSGVPWLSGVIIACQIAILAAGYRLFTNPGMKARFARLTDTPAGYERGLLGGIQPGSVDPATYTPSERALREAAERVAGGWPHRVTTKTQRFPTGSAVSLQWNEGSRVYAVAARSFQTGVTEIIRLPVQPAPGAAPALMHRWTSLPASDELTRALRIAMETTQGQGR
ncbi:MAG TPA: site-2 protease family protein [Thermomicrobiales bacterium]|nr:site-2 protease family protein [Thermomicrobiales bacterium]